MKSLHKLSIFAITILIIVGCEEKSPGIIDDLVFNNDTEWMERDTVADPYELANDGDCCNDFVPYPVAMGTSVLPVLESEDDLDYFKIEIESGTTGRLIVWTTEDYDETDDDFTIRVFNSNLVEYDDILIYKDTFDDGGERYWTALFGAPRTFNVLVAGNYSGTEMVYHLDWEAVPEQSALELVSPQNWDTALDRASEYTIDWTTGMIGTNPVSIGLMKGAIIIDEILSDYNPHSSQYNWQVPDNLEPGSDYRLIIYYNVTMDISDEFQIR